MPQFPPTPHEETVLLQMNNLARQCEIGTNPEDIHDRCEKALELFLDLWSEPKTPVGKVLRREFTTFFSECLRGDGFESAAYKLMPQYHQKAGGPQYVFGLSWGNQAGSPGGQNYPTATITHPVTFDVAVGVGPTLALALLAAVLRACIEWPDTWQTGYYENDSGQSSAQA